MEGAFNKKNIIGFIVVVILLIVAYGYFFNSSDENETLSSSITSNVSSVGNDLLSTLTQLRSLKLDTTVLDGTAFKSLQDFSVALQPEVVSRRNPFLPIGEGGGPKTATTTGGGF